MEATFVGFGAACGVSLKLGKVLSWVDKVLPGALGAKLEAALGISGPAVVPLVPEVVWVGVGHSLHSIVALAVEPAASLEELCVASSHVVVLDVVENEVSWHDHLSEQSTANMLARKVISTHVVKNNYWKLTTYEEDDERSGDVLLGHLAHDEVSVQVVPPGSGGRRLCEVELVVTGHAVITHHTLQSALHVRHYAI